MNRSLLPFLICLLAAMPAIEASAQVIDPREMLKGPVEETVLRVRDGDSVEVHAHIWPGQRLAVSVRLRGIDAPELRARCPAEREMAQMAKRHLIDLMTGNTIYLKRIGGGKYYGRILADIWTKQGQNIAEEMLNSGLAVQYRHRKRQDWCVVKPASFRP